MNWKKSIYLVLDRFTKEIEPWYQKFRIFNILTYKGLKELQLIYIGMTGKKHGLNINSWKDFRNLPLKTKEDIRNFKPKLKGKKFTYHRSSGSTGQPLECYGNDYLQSVKAAIFQRAWKWIGRKEGDKVLRLTAGKPQWWWYDYWRNVKPLNYRKITIKHLYYIINHEPKIIHGQAGAIREIVTELKEIGYESILKNTYAYLMSEDTKSHIKPLKKYFKDVYTGYGLAELCTVASECKYHNLHVNMETAIVEIIKGEIVVTDLLNTITPIIRYRTNDTGKIKKSDCECGYKGDILYDVQGRAIDYYDGPEVKGVISYKLLSPIHHKLFEILNDWKVRVDLKDKKFILYGVVKKSIPLVASLFINEYERYITEKTGLGFEFVEKKSISNKMRMKLLEVCE